MRSDQTAEFVAARPYPGRRERNRALLEHARRVMRARQTDSDSSLARQPMLTVSGTTVMAQAPAECLIGPHGCGAAFSTSSGTHRVLNRNGERCVTWLCVPHWSEYLRTEEDGPDASVAEVRYSKAMND